MTQTRRHWNSLPLQLVPRQESELEDWTRAQLLKFQVQTPTLNLVPGQAGELAVSIQSLVRYPEVRWLLAVTGDFPNDWLPEKKGLHPADGQPGREDFWPGEPPAGSGEEQLPDTQLPDTHEGQPTSSEGLPFVEHDSTRPGQPARVIGFGQQAETILTFNVPENFFEQQASSEQNDGLPKLTYEAQISLYAALYDSAQSPESLNKIVLAGFRTIQLRVRPRSAYTAFLPGIYRSSDFTSRFLAMFEQAFDPAVQTMDNLWAYLDPLTAPVALLPFLAQWVAWPWDPQLDTGKQRRLLRHAVTLYRCRGTRYGLRLYLHLYTELPLDDDTVPESQKSISVVENHRPAFTLGEAKLSQTPMLGGGRPFHFTVTLRPRGQNDLDEAKVRNLIDQVKPAYCTYDLSIES
jgi:phage tail-like protein